MIGARTRFGLVFLALAVAAVAQAHNARSGWTYPAWCCGAGDCAELPPGAVRATAAGWVITLRPGSNPAIPAGTAPYTLTVPYAHPEIRESPDRKFHLCLYPTPRDVRCFFAPAGGF
jgi:hypothetical protein